MSSTMHTSLGVASPASETAKTGPGSTHSVISSTEPKKSARLAEKRKLRQGSEPPSASSPPKTPVSSTAPLIHKSMGVQYQKSPSPTPPSSKWTVDGSEYFTAHETSTETKVCTGSTGISAGKGEGSSEDEWLDALESGTMNLMDDELREIENSELRTLRRKGLNVQQSPQISETLPVKPPLTQEMIIIRAAKSQKRRLQAQQKKEIDKKRTMDRLLKKQNSKNMKPPLKVKDSRNLSVPRIKYIIRADMNTISFPIQSFLPGKPITNASLRIPEKILCGVGGCKNAKKYSCSKTNVPLCSLACYKANLANRQIQIAE